MIRVLVITLICKATSLQHSMAAPAPALSVVLPVHEAMPYLTVAVRDVLRQEVAGGLELVCAWDGGAEDSWAFLVEAAGKLQGGSVEVVDAPAPPTAAAPPPPAQGVPAWAPAANPARSAAPRHAGDEDHPAVEESPCDAPTAAEVVAACVSGNTLRVVKYADGANRGQGSAMSLALARTTASLIAQMEADDRRPNEKAFALMIAALQANNWDGCSDAQPFGATDNMRAYCAWQNALERPAALAASRFIEIPALHQTGLFTREAVEAVLAATGGCYRDGPAPPFAGDGAVAAELDVPVDSCWWLQFFAQGLTCGRVRSPPSDDAELPETALFGWRQHPRQKTRVDGRLSTENLRAIKLDAFLRAYKPKKVVMVSVGRTLEAWAAGLRDHEIAPADVVAVEWRPSKRQHAEDCPPQVVRASPDCVRAFAYGNAKARQRIRLRVPDWDDALDTFVA